MGIVRATSPFSTSTISASTVSPLTLRIRSTFLYKNTGCCWPRCAVSVTGGSLNWLKGARSTKWIDRMRDLSLYSKRTTWPEKFDRPFIAVK